jgi:hypothetical protein
MKNSLRLLALYVLVLISIIVYACTKIDVPPTPQSIDLGVKAQSTSIKSIVQTGNSVTANFATTVGAKYSVQIIPFGTDVPVSKDGFTATDTVTKKTYDLSNLPKKDYDLIFIDISGSEVKYPITIK